MTIVALSCRSTSLITCPLSGAPRQPAPNRATRFVGLAVAVLVCVSSAVSAEQPKTGIETPMRTRLVALSQPASRNIDSNKIAAFSFLPKLYAALGDRLAWSNAANVQALRQAVERSWEDGLIPSDFHAAAIAKDDLANASDANRTIERDIVMSDSLLRLLYQLYFGKVSPNGLDPNWNFARPVLSEDPAQLVATALEQGKVAELIDKARLSHPLYSALKATLQAYTQMAQNGGWAQVPAGAALKPGTQDPRIGALRARLTTTGEYDPAGAAPSDIFDDKLAAALRRFQVDHGLADDGALGPQTIDSLNVTAQERIDQIRINLERARWILRSVGPDMVVVNIAGFYLRVVLDSKPAWRTRVIVGQTFHKTPIFTEPMKSIVFNPDWTVPRSIIRNEIFAKAVANPDYLAANNYTLKDSKGTAVDAATLNWAEWTAQTFPYGVVQRPGSKNALGLVKFLFPNKYSVYLHDTPRRDLFGQSGRTFSHGCIRVEDPMKLAEVILNHQFGWDRAKINSIVETGKLSQVNLTKPLPVLLLYWTVDPGFDGSAQFYRDIYGRDARLLKALNAEFAPTQN